MLDQKVAVRSMLDQKVSVRSMLDQKGAVPMFDQKGSVRVIVRPDCWNRSCAAGKTMIIQLPLVYAWALPAALLVGLPIRSPFFIRLHSDFLSSNNNKQKKRTKLPSLVPKHHLYTALTRMKTADFNLNPHIETNDFNPLHSSFCSIPPIKHL